jgi:hypothetical protein
MIRYQLDFDPQVTITAIDVLLVCRVHISPLLHSSSRLFRLFGLTRKISMTLTPVDGLFWAQRTPSCHTENLMVKVWVSL